MSIPHAQFKALRQLCGLTSEDVGQELGVTTRTVIRWEDAKTSDIPQYASRFIEEEAKRMATKVAAVIEQIDNIEQQNGEPECVEMSYKPSDSIDNRRNNATTRMVAACLLLKQQEFSIRYDSETTQAIEQAKKAHQE